MATRRRSTSEPAADPRDLEDLYLKDKLVLDLLDRVDGGEYDFDIAGVEDELTGNLAKRKGAKLEMERAHGAELQEARMENAAYRSKAVGDISAADRKFSRLRNRLERLRNHLRVGYYEEINRYTNADADAIMRNVLRKAFLIRDDLEDFVKRGSRYLDEYTDMRFSLAGARKDSDGGRE